MSLKQEIETWVTALAHYDRNDFDDAIAEFAKIADTSKIFFNMGIIHATLGEHERAVECYQRAVRLDQYFAVAYFQQGVSNFLIGDFEEALANFNDALLYLRGNTTIDYEQLGLSFKLYSCEVLFNRGMCYVYLQQLDAGMLDLGYAAKEKIVDDHDVIDEALREGAEGFTVFSMPIGVVYRPNEAKVRNLKTKDYLGKARLVATSDNGNAYTGFAGLQVKASYADLADNRLPVAQPITFMASPLVRPGLQSRRQLQPEPPANRTVFPPTPPPELERLSRGLSVRTTGPKPFLGKLSILTNHDGGSGRRYEKASVSPDRRSVKTSISALDQRQDLSPPDLGASRSERAYSPAERLRTSRSHATLLSRGASQKEPSWRPSGPIEEEPFNFQIEGLRLGGISRQGQAQTQGPLNSGTQQYYGNDDDEADSVRAASFDDDLAARRWHLQSLPRSQSNSRSTSRAAGAGSRRPEMRQVRVKVHADEVRYVLISTGFTFAEFVDKIREKLCLKKEFKIKMRDEDVPTDMITMGDQDDLDMAFEVAREHATKERMDVGRLEVWIYEI